MIQHPPYIPSRRAFTLMELMIAMAVASLMLFLINYIFNDTTQAVTRGMSLSDIIGNERAAGEQFAQDAEAMIGPDVDTDGTSADPPVGKGGVLVIVNHAINTQLKQRFGEITRDVRSDQLMFFRTRTSGTLSLYPLVPKTTSTFANDFADGTGTEHPCDYMKVWFGHAKRTEYDGLSAPNLGSGVNQYANNWVLARQATFLVDNTAGSLAGTIYANLATYNSATNGYGAATTPAALAEVPHEGLTDICAQVVGSATNGGSIINDLTTNGYPAAVYKYLFLAERLWANPSPNFDAADAYYSYSAWQYAQMHPVFVPSVSDFIVEFAADTDLDGEIDRHGAYPAGNDDNVPPVAYSAIPANGIVWYTADAYENYPGATGGYDSTNPLTFGLPASTYKTTVRDGTPAVANATEAFVWRHDDEATNLTTDATTPIQESFWPYLIRIRYRVHDPKGQLESGSGQHGVWFEHILKVNRP